MTTQAKKIIKFQKEKGFDKAVLFAIPFISQTDEIDGVGELWIFQDNSELFVFKSGFRTTKGRNDE